MSGMRSRNWTPRAASRVQHLRLRLAEVEAQYQEAQRLLRAATQERDEAAADLGLSEWMDQLEALTDAVHKYGGTWHENFYRPAMRALADAQGAQLDFAQDHERMPGSCSKSVKRNGNRRECSSRRPRNVSDSGKHRRRRGPADSGKAPEAVARVERVRQDKQSAEQSKAQKESSKPSPRPGSTRRPKISQRKKPSVGLPSRAWLLSPGRGNWRWPTRSSQLLSRDHGRPRGRWTWRGASKPSSTW